MNEKNKLSIIAINNLHLGSVRMWFPLKSHKLYVRTMFEYCYNCVT